MQHAYFGDRKPLAFAHRGGAKRWPENTLEAFGGAIALGYRHIETDLHLTQDGHLVCFHDDTLDRTTGGAGLLRERKLAELKSLDAGYRFADDRGDFPFRGKGLTIPTLKEALDLDPEVRFNLELKPEDPAIVQRVWDFIVTHGVHDRVLVASAHDRQTQRFRKLAQGRVCTSAGQSGALRFWLGVRSGLHRWDRYPFDALQVPPTSGPLRVIDRKFVDAAHQHGLQVHVWTIDDPEQMQALYDTGVDGVMTDRPEVLLEVLQRRT